MREPFPGFDPSNRQHQEMARGLERIHPEHYLRQQFDPASYVSNSRALEDVNNLVGQREMEEQGLLSPRSDCSRYQELDRPARLPRPPLSERMVIRPQEPSQSQPPTRHFEYGWIWIAGWVGFLLGFPMALKVGGIGSNTFHFMVFFLFWALITFLASGVGAVCAVIRSKR
jgi:hypothetical protein